MPPRPLPPESPTVLPLSARLGALALIGALLAAIGWRFVGLDHLVVWHDEVFTLLRVFGFPQPEVEAAIFSRRLLDPAFLLQFQAPDPRYGWWESIRAFTEHPEHAPLYYVLAKLATGLPLEPIAAARGVSALFGALLPLAVFWLMRELFGRGPIPWVAALLVACSPTHFVYAQEARQYALWTLTSVAATAAAVRALHRDRRRDWTLYALLCALGLWSHVLFALLLPIHAAYGLLAYRGRPHRALARRWMLAASAAVLAFSPWLLVFVFHGERAVHYTEWLSQPIGRMQMVIEWATHFPRLFVDFNWTGLGWWNLLLIPLVWAAIRFLRRAPRPASGLLGALALLYILPMLIPDLLFDGSRSQHVRYALPSVLAVQLMVAWVLGDALAAPAAGTRRWAAAALAVLAAGGLASLAAIERADTWWSKNYSAHSAELARTLNGRERPLVLASGSGVAVGELISLAYGLDPKVRLWGERWGVDSVAPLDGFDLPLVLTPSLELLLRLARGDYRLTPIAGTWQWLQAERRAPPPPPPIADPVPAAERTDPMRPPPRPAGDTP